MQSHLVMTTIESRPWRFADAHLSDDGQMVELAGRGEPVLPLGAYDEGALKPEPTKARYTVADAYEHLVAVTALDPAAQAEHVLRHVQMYGLSQLCAAHGLPRWHTWPERDRPAEAARSLAGTVPRGASCPSAPVDESGPGLLSVAAVVRMAEGYYAVEDLAYRMRNGRTITRRPLEDAAALLPKGDRDVTADLALIELERDGVPLPGHTRQLVVKASEELLKQSSARAGVVWIARQRPELVMKAFDAWGLYAVELVRRLAVDNRAKSVFVCSVCGDAVVLMRRPKEGDQIYCADPECRREKERRKKARQRARRALSASTKETDHG